MEGISFFTVIMLVLGLLAHNASQYIKARKSNPALTPFNYYTDNGWETFLSALFAVVAFLLLPELATKFPDALGAIGIDQTRTGLSSFLIGFLSSTIADFFGNRFNNISGVSK